MTTNTMNNKTTTAINTNTINWTKAILAGVIGTIAFDIVGLIFNGQFWDVPALLATKLFGDASLLPLGVIGHFGNGIALAVIFAALAPSLWGNRWAKAFTFVVAETVLGVYLFMFPLLDLGAFGLNAGIAFPLISMARHLAFGAVLAWFMRD